MATAKHVLEEALKLDDEEREKLLQELWASFDGGELGPESEDEIQRRIADVDSGRMETVAGDDVMDRLRQRFRGP